MSVEVINLRKLLQLGMSDPKLLQSLLREDIRAEKKKENGESAGGGDFFVPFWAAARRHAKGETNLAVEIPKLVAAHSGRHRLYPLLTKAFLEWWNEKRAWRNEPFQILNDNVRTQHYIAEFGLTIKIENLISGVIGDDDHRLVYPYFSEKPKLTLDAARIGLYILHSALPAYPIDNFRILDILRSTSYSIGDASLTGKEAKDLAQMYKFIKQEREKLLLQYA